MIDLRYEAKNFKPVETDTLTQVKLGELDSDITLSYSMYNSALENIDNGKDDIARSDLKKAVSLNPLFHEARILLGVCTFANGDRIGAVRIFNSIKQPKLREKALTYMDYLAEIADKTEYVYGEIRTTIGNFKDEAEIEVNNKENIANDDTEVDEGNVEKLNEASDTYDDNLIFKQNVNAQVSFPVKSTQKQRKTDDKPLKPFINKSFYQSKKISDDTIKNKEYNSDNDFLSTKDLREKGKLIAFCALIMLVFMIVICALLVHTSSENKKLKEQIKNIPVIETEAPQETSR